MSGNNGDNPCRPLSRCTAPDGPRGSTARNPVAQNATMSRCRLAAANFVGALGIKSLRISTELCNRPRANSSYALSLSCSKALCCCAHPKGTNAKQQKTPNSTKRRSEMNRYARVLASFCFLQPVGSSAHELMGSPTPKAPVSSPRLAEPSDWDSATPDGVSGKTIAKRLATPITDHGALPVRGLQDIEIYRAASPSVVMVMTDTGLGSGSYLGANRILTNAHVVGDKKKVGIVFKPQQEGAKVNPANILVGEVSRLDNTRDLAIVTITDAPASVRPLEFGTEAEIQIGADVHAIGHPTGEAWTYTKGLINQFRRDYEWKAAGNQHRADVIQTQTPINPGNSGGPLIGESGKILGVNSFKKAGRSPQLCSVGRQRDRFSECEQPANVAAARGRAQLQAGQDFRWTQQLGQRPAGSGRLRIAMAPPMYRSLRRTTVAGRSRR